MESKILKAIEEYSLLENGERVIVALSGGADSVALFHVLLALKDKLSLTIYACHINHLLRGEESFRDERFVRELCEKNGTELFVRRCDIKKLAAEKQIGCEECGRQVRYEYLEELSKSLDAKIATAHTATDSIETIIMNITRGSSIKGARGIPPKRGNIIRPLILASRYDTENYCERNGIPYVDDSTNAERIYTRNKIRLDVVPVLREINPSVEQSFSRFSKYMYELDEFIDKMSYEAITSAAVLGGYSCKKLLSMPEPIMSRAVEIICGSIGGGLESVHIELIEKAIEKGGSVSLKNGVEAVVKQGIFRVYRRDRIETDDKGLETPIKINETITMLGKIVSVKLMYIDAFNERLKNGDDMSEISLDYDKILSTAVFRSRRAGDFIAPRGRKLTKPLRKLMSEMKIPAERRDSIVLLADGSNIIWAEGIGAADACCVSPSTERVLTINIL